MSKGLLRNVGLLFHFLGFKRVNAMEAEGRAMMAQDVEFSPMTQSPTLQTESVTP